jgi:branched-chain amino acid transport system permease protein
MGANLKTVLAFAFMATLLACVGVLQSWSLALAITNMCLISAVMALGVNIQWGYAGLFNVGVMGFTALGGVAAVLVSTRPVAGAWQAGGVGVLTSAVLLAVLVTALVFIRKKLPKSAKRSLLLLVVFVLGIVAIRWQFAPAVQAIEKFEPAKTGFLGGLGLPIIVSWIVGGLFAAGAAWLIGKIALGLRSDYLAIATLGISEIIIAMIKNEDWLTRGVKNVSGLNRPVPYEVDLQSSAWFHALVEKFHSNSLPSDPIAKQAALQQLIIESSSLFVKLCYTGLFLGVLCLLLWLAHRAQKAPWGRMMRGIRDNEAAANAMGKNVTRRHLQVFVLGSAVVGIAGAMMTTLDGQLTPGTYQPLRYTFLIWVMVIVGGSGNNLGSVLGAFVIWFFWIEAEPLGQWFIGFITSGMATDSALKLHLIESAAHMRLILMGLILLLVLRFSPNGILPERIRR